MVDKEYLNEDNFCGKPVIELNNINNKFSFEKYSFFVALGYNNLNEIRKKILRNKKIRI